MRSRWFLATAATATVFTAAGLVGATAGTASSTAQRTAFTTSTSAVSAVDTTSCNGVLNGGGEGPLDKRLTSVKQESNGTYTFTFTVTSGRAAGTYRLRDCVYIDTGAAGYQNEPVIGGTDDKDLVFTAGSGGSVAVFSVTVGGIGQNVTVCDRAAVSGVTGTGVDFTDKSNEVCVDPNRAVVVPEAPVAVALPLAALAALGVVWMVRRRRSAAPAA